MKIFDHPHEQVVFCHDPVVGLRAIIAIHSTRLGPALGGVRMFPYADEEAALHDVLRLAEAMTYKAAVAGLPLGGGKAVILGDPGRDKTPELFGALGRNIDDLGGRYITAEDSGTNQNDMAQIAKHTRHVTGIPRADGTRGDVAAPTALGVFLSMKVALRRARGTDDLSKAHVALAGVGNVGSELAKLLAAARAKLTIADKDTARAQNAARDYGAKVVAPDAIHTVKADIYAPCALGGVLNDDTIPHIGAKIIVGAANNQLLDATIHSAMLAERGILYAPDYVVNAGGIIQIYLDMPAESKKETASTAAKKISVSQIADTLKEIFTISQNRACTTEAAAQEIAQRRLAA